MARKQPKPMTQDDIQQASYVVGASISPDSSQAVYVLSQTTGSGDEEKQVTSLWSVSTDGGEPHCLTPGTGNEGNPQIGPDGDLVYFTSDRSGVNQIYRMSLSGGEAEQITSLPQGVTLFELSPDGKTIAFAALNAPPAPPGPDDHVRVTRSFWRMDGVGYVDKVTQTLHSISAKGGKPKARSGGGGMITAIHWSADSKELGYVSTFEESNGFFESTLRVVSGTTERVIVANTMLTDFFWAGNRIGFSAGTRMAEHPRLTTVSDSDGKKRRSHSAKRDLGVGAFFQVNSPAARNPAKMIPSADGRSVYINVGVGGEGQVFNIAIKGKERADAVLTGPCMRTIIAGNDNSLLLAKQDHNHPPELTIYDIASGEERQLTDHNGEWLSRIHMPDFERVTVRSAPGVEIEGWVYKPKHVRPPYKTILYIHGGPHAGFGDSFMADMHEFVGAGYAVAYCNPRGSTGYTSEFSSSIVGCWGHPEFEDFNAFLNKLIRMGIAHKDKLAVTGVSGGGHLSGWLIGHTNRFKAAIPEQGLYNMFSMWGVSDAGPMLINLEMEGKPHENPERYWELSPLAHAHKCKTPTLLIQGENDIRCPMEQAEQMYQVMNDAGCTVELLRLANCSHGAEIGGPPPLRRFRSSAMIEWFDRYVK